MKTGILVHAYHLETVHWDELVWGKPAEDKLGSLTMLAWLLLTECPDSAVSTITIGCRPSRKDDLSESEYTKLFLLKNFDKLADFPRLQPLLKRLSAQEREHLRIRLENSIAMPVIQITLEEVAAAAQIFTSLGVARVTQICSASHAPRCVQIQATSRLQGLIPAAQQWYVIPSDMGFSGALPDETVVLEPPHRGDDPMLNILPTLAQAIKPILYSSPEEKKELIALVKDFLRRRQT